DLAIRLDNYSLRRGKLSAARGNTEHCIDRAVEGEGQIKDASRRVSRDHELTLSDGSGVSNSYDLAICLNSNGFNDIFCIQSAQISSHFSTGTEGRIEITRGCSDPGRRRGPHQQVEN